MIAVATHQKTQQGLKQYKVCLIRAIQIVATHQKTQQGLKRISSRVVDSKQVGRNASENPAGIETEHTIVLVLRRILSQRIRKPSRD